ncbi:MAG TPA: ATP-binding cassette domain-containing protein, partial [Polyangium sp.]|nr:ATP-binding cassette domain-containing protein [Polyangium sp.]
PKRLEDELTRAIMGGEPPPEASPPALAEDAEVALSIEDLVLVDASGNRVLDGLNLAVKKGEIVGIAGIEGNGQRELVRAVAGLEPGVAGSIVLGGARLPAVRSTEDLRKRRRAIAVVHEDRHADGLMLDATVGDNLVLGELGQIDGPGAEAALIKHRIDRFGVNPPDAARRAGELSGGNQQKVVVGRALDRIEASPERALVVLGQPTRGVDVGAAATIHGAIVTAAEKGLAVLVVSADLGELRRLSHRILVLHRGRIVMELPPTSADDVIGRAMLGMEDA